MSLSNDPAFRRSRARLGGFAVNDKDPEHAKNAGQRGGIATANKFPGGPRAFGVALAMRRWYGTPLPVFGSRARAGSDDVAKIGNFASDPAQAPKVTRRLRRVSPRPGQQLPLL